jgi:type II secretory pathway component GspD/PulD (secretin)
MAQPIIKYIKHTLLISLVATLLGCAQGKIDPLDRQNGTTKSEIKDTFYNNKTKQDKDKNGKTSKASAKDSLIPQSSRMITIPTPPKLNTKQLISFSVTDQVPLKDVLIELAKSAKLDIDLDPTIEGGVIISAKNRSLTEVLDRICTMGNLRYSLDNKVLHIERDSPFAKNYLVDFLIDGSLWAEVETNVKAIINDGGSTADSTGGSISSNKLSNMITVFASKKNHKKVANYIEQVRKNSSAQVLIEAKVIEVTLTDNYKTGIDWSWAGGSSTKISQLSGGASGVFDGTNPNPISLVFGNGSLFGGNLTSTVSALEEFGAVKAIASPRINALNNQKATLNFTKKLIYFTSEISSNTTTTNGVSDVRNTVTATQHEKDTGTELTITPVIDLVTNEVTLSVQPKITIKTDEVTQTVVNPTDNSVIENLIPIINTRELNTIAKIQSGSILVIGGVMTEDSNNSDNGIPFLSRIPVLGLLFKSTTRLSAVTETVIFIKATIINPSDGVNKYDRELNDKFSSTSRPFF